jgi:hypothetical protein
VGCSQMRMSPFALLATLAIGTGATSSWAHHSGAMFDAAKTVTLQGTVKEFQWSNPHCWIQLIVVDDSGAMEEWSIEMPSPTGLARVGWQRVSLHPGDKITAQIHPLKTGEKGGGYVSVLLPDGRTLPIRNPAGER